MANDGKLIFPVKFDLNSAVKEASGDVDKVLRELQTRINAKPLTIKPKVDDAALKNMSDRLANLSIPKTLSGSGKNTFLAKEGSINALSAAMRKCINEWNNLSESERIANRESGEYTAKAQAIISRFAELTAASNTFAKSLQEIARESKTAADAEMKRNQKAAEQVAVLSSQERTLDQVNNKIKQLTQIMRGLDKNDPIWKTLAGNLERVRQKQTELQAAQKAELAQIQGEYNAVKQLISSLQGYGNTIGQIQTKLAAFKSTLNNTTIGGAAFREAALQIKMMNEELQRANQLVQNYQAKSLQGVGKKNTDAAVRQMEQYQQRIQQIDAQMNLAHAKGQDMGSQQMIKLLQERIALEEKLKNAMTTGADAAKQKLDAEIAAQQKLIEETSKRAEAYNKKRQQEAEDLAAQQRKAAEEARIKQESIIKEQQANEARKRILNEQRLSYDTLAQKLQMLENARNKTDIGATRWTRLTAEINKTRDSLKVITDEMDKAAKRSERLARLREILAMSTQSMAGLNARLQEANAQIQNVDRGTAAFDRLAQKIAQLSVEYQKVQQYAQDFAQKAFQGLSTTDTSKRVAELQMWRQQLQQVEEEYNRLRNFTMQNGSNTATDAQLNALLQQRMDIVRNINQITKTAEQAQVEREKEINRIIESRNAKQKAHNDAIVKAVQARKQERTMLMANERTIDNVTKKLQHWQTKLNSTDMRSGQFNQIAQEVQRLTAKLERMKQKLAEATGQTEQGANRQKSAVDKASESFRKQETYVSRLLKRLAATYASFSAASNFLTKVREVTAQFELQRISLGAILQDQAKANLLFSEIKSFALTSPVKLLDLTKYTKQLAAYKIGYDELFETTKRLTDVSVGLGVSMDRIILMYGQIRATGYLRASEVRQATEAGIPIVEELAAKLTKTNGELVTAAQVMDMISKRQISFEQVKEVFEDMTSAGGIFYNMQEKQGNTLYGMWAKLGDAAAIMYDEIGNTGIVNSAMKGFIQILSDLMRNWKSWTALIGIAGGAYLAAVGGMKLMRLATFQYTAAGQRLIAIQKANVLATKETVVATKNAGIMARWGARQDLAIAAAKLKATTATNLLTKSLYALKAAFLSNPFGMIIMAITTIIALFIDFNDEVDELQSSLSEINEKYAYKSLTDAKNFKRLADAAVHAAAGSKAQRDALDELNRTYGDILGSENLQIERLEALKGEYSGLVAEIEAYNTKMKYQERESAYKDYYSQNKKDKYADLVDEISTIGVGRLEAGREAGSAIGVAVQEGLLAEIEEHGMATTETAEDIIRERLTGLNISKGLDDPEFQAWSTVNRLKGEIKDYVEVLNEEAAALRENNKERDAAVRSLSAYQGTVDNLLRCLEEIRAQEHGVNIAKTDDGTQITPEHFDFDLNNAQDLLNAQIEQMTLGVKAMLHMAGVEWSDSFATLYGAAQTGATEISSIDFPNIIEKIVESTIDERTKGLLLSAIEQAQKAYREFAPSGQTERVIMGRVNELAAKYEVQAGKANQFFMKEGESLSDYRKRLEDEVKNILDAKAKLELGIKLAENLGQNTEALEKDLTKYENQRKFLEALLGIVGRTQSQNSGSDQRLQQLQEMFKTLQSINKEYEDLTKKQGAARAANWVKGNYEATLKRLNKLAKKFNLQFDFPLTPENLQKYGRQIAEKIEALNLKGGDKAAIALQLELAKDAQSRLEKAIEGQLKAIADRISRTKAANEFYEKILDMTGDYDLAAKASVSIYGDTGHELQEQLAQQVRQYFQNDQINIKIPVDVITADNQINYKRLAEFAEQMKDVLGKEPYEAIKKIAEQGQKDLAKTYEGYLKDLEKAKTYADKRVELARTTAAKIREIENNPQLSNEQKASLKRGYQEREDREAAKLEYEAFKDTPLYVQMFENLEYASTSTLDTMKSRLEALSRIWGTALDPTQLKEIQSRMNEIDTQLRTRNPFKTLKESYLQYRDAVRSVTVEGANEKAGAAATAFNQVTTMYGADSAQAKAAEKELKAREKILEIARKVTAEDKKGQDALDEAAQIANDNLQIKRGDLEIAAAEEQALRDKSTYEDPNKDPKVIAAHEAVEAAKEEVNLAERVAEITTNNAKTSKTLKENFVAAGKQATKYLQIGGDLAHAVADTMEALGGDEDDVQFWNDIGTALDDISAGVSGITDAAEALMKGDVAGAISSTISVIPNMVKGFVGLFSAGKVRKANKEIKKQQKLLERLEYTYSRLESVVDKVFGRDFINNYNQRMQNLQAQAEAYQKQANAERSKGKKADKDKIKEYENAYRDTMDEIADMQGEIAEKMYGTDLTSAARDFAQAWLDAYAEFSSTADAMSEKFHDMIENMVVESLLAKVMETALKPAFDMIDNMSETDFYSSDFWKRVVEEAEKGAKSADYGAGVAMEFLEQAGLSMRDMADEYTGIKREVAGASEETMSSVAVIGNTLMYYVSPIPRIDENLAVIRQVMENGTSSSPSGAVDETTLWNRHLELQQGIYEHTRRSSEKCEEMAIQCAQIASDIHKVIVPKNGGSATSSVQVRIQ